MTSRFTYLTISIMLMVVMSWFLTQRVIAEDNVNKQIDQIKVAYLANFIRFTQWQKDKKNASQPWIITIIGDTAFANDIHDAFPNGKYMDRPIQIQDLPKLFEDKNELNDDTREKLHASHVIYVRSGSHQEHQAILALSRSPDFLYISDMTNAAKAGCMIELFNLKSRVAFKVNPRAISNAKIHVSSKVLRLGIPVNSSN
ncbi:MAG: YfiR family protein [Phycisphaeraceae bacterium JB051]